MDVSALTSERTPAEIYPGVRECIDRHDYKRAVRLAGLAGVYGRFDTLRVLDRSAHEAIPALQSLYIGQGDRQAVAAFQATFRDDFAQDSPELLQLCTEVRKLGPPTYYPSYMLLHGLSSFTGTGGGLRPDFNASEAWESSLAGYLHCP